MALFWVIFSLPAHAAHDCVGGMNMPASLWLNRRNYDWAVGVAGVKEFWLIVLATAVARQSEGGF